MNGWRLVGWLLLAGIVLAATFGPPLSADPTEQSLVLALAPPGAEFLLGSDHLGRSELARVLAGARLSLLTAGTAVLLAVGIGGLLGLAAAALGGIWAGAVRLACDTALALPSFLAILLLASLFSSTGLGLVLAIAATTWPEPCRVALLTAEEAAHQPWVQAARLAGAPRLRVATRLIAPPICAPLATVAGLMFGHTILSVAALGFLGLGIRPPQPEWGAMIVDALPYIGEAPGLLVFPAGAIAVTVTAVFLVTGPPSWQRS